MAPVQSFTEKMTNAKIQQKILPVFSFCMYLTCIAKGVQM